MSSDRLTVRFSPPPGEGIGRDVFAGAAVSMVPLGLGWPGVPLTLAAWCGLVWFGYRFRQQRMELDQFGVTVVRVRSSRQINFDDVIAVVAQEHVSFVGDDFRVGLDVGLDGRISITGFLQRHVPEIAINPVEPWIDRHGRWHSELHGNDPVESIRSIRRAAFGRWSMEVKVLGGCRFQAVAHTLAGAPGMWVGDEHATLADATNDAIAMIEQLRHE